MLFWAWVFSSLSVLALVLPVLAADPDLFARLAVGQLVLDLGEVPWQDPFAFSPKKPIWVDHEWLSGLVFRLIDQRFGDAGLLCFRGFMVCAALAALVWAIRIWNKDYKSELATAALIYVGSAFSSTIWASPIRSQVFTYLFLPLVLGLAARNSLGLLLLPLIFTIWANAHGGFVVGLGLLGLIALIQTMEQRKIPVALSLALLCSLVATCITPYAPLDFWSYILSAISMARPSIGEWQHVSIFSLSAIPLHALLVLLLLGWFKGGVERKWCRLIPVLVALYFGYRHDRLGAIAWFSALILALPYLISGLRFIGRIWPGDLLVLSRSFVSVAVCLPLVSILLSAREIGWNLFKLDRSNYPEQAVAWLKECGSGGKLLVDFNNGSFALWKLYPQYTVSIDGRYEELYPDSTGELVTRALANDPEAFTMLKPDYVLAAVGAEFPQLELQYKDEKFQVLGQGISESRKTLCFHKALNQTLSAKQRQEHLQIAAADS